MSTVFAIGSTKHGKATVINCISADQVSIYSLKLKKLGKMKVKSVDCVVNLKTKAMNQIFAAECSEELHL